MKSHRSSASIKDIAEAAGVSLMTVSNVLRPRREMGRSQFSKETEKRVLAAARKLDYLPNRTARAMRSKQTGVVGFVTTHFSEPENTTGDPGGHINFFLRGIVQTLSPAGRHVALVQLNELELMKSHKLPDALRERFFDGVVIHLGLSDNAIRLIEEFSIPVIHLDSGLLKPENCIYRNEREAGRQVTTRLIELGHRKIGFAVGRGAWKAYNTKERFHYSFGDRYEGYLQAMKENDLQSSILEGYDADVISSKIASDKLTATVTNGGVFPWFRSAIQLGKRIPDDFSFMACDVNPQAPDHGDKPGGAIYDRCKAGRIAAELLSQRIDNGGNPVPSVELPFEIIDGSMAARCKAETSLETAEGRIN